MIDAIDPDLFTEPSGGAGSPTYGDIAAGSLARQDEILGFLSREFGRYPFSTSGGIVDDYDNLFFALETQTRPVYSKLFFTDPASGDSVVVHELAHQWFGDSVAVAAWQHIWLNEGFATYAEWLWSEDQGLGTTQEIFDAYYNGIPTDDPFWDVVIGDPGVEFLFDNAVYYRGAMTLHTLRKQVGDADFFRIIRTWAATKAGGNGTTPEFIALAERISGQQLDKLFDVWLFTPGRPALDDTFSSAARTGKTSATDVAEALRTGGRLRR
jgi:aminopeptidase N